MRRFCKGSIYALLTFFLISVCGLPSQAASGVIISPTSFDFGVETVGLKTGTTDIQVTNNSSRSITITGFSLSSPEFQLTQGVAPLKIARNTTTHYTLVFAPTGSGLFTGTFTVTVQNMHDPLTVALQGTGKTTTAAATLNATAIDFGSVVQGQTSAAQSVTVTNTGTQLMKLVSATADPPFLTSTVNSTILGPGKSVTFDVYFSPTTTGTFTNALIVVYDSLPPQGIDLTGIATAASSLALTTFATLPGATQNAAYSVALAGAGGAIPYSWSLPAGSSLPSGLDLSNTGVISGTVASTVAKGAYLFTAQVADSSVPPAIATKQLSITVGGPTGANCDNISFDVPGTNTPIVGLDVLGAGTYLGAEGGLYPNGSNVRPADHDAYGVGLAQAIQPLDANGNFDPNGKEVLIIIGESNVHIEGESIVRDATADPSRNPAVVIVDGGQGDGTAKNLKDPNSPWWTTMINYILPNSGVTAKQVVAAWVEPTDGLSVGTFPTDIARLQSEIESEAQNLLINFPNIKVAYFSSRIYSGYSNGVNTINPEPYAFEDSFAVKWAIQEQLDGNPRLNFDPSKGPVMAPWLSWGPYTWADGLVVPSSNGSVWSCQDIKDDGTHPDKTAGAEEVANQVLKFFKTDDTTTPWFLTH